MKMQNSLTAVKQAKVINELYNVQSQQLGRDSLVIDDHKKSIRVFIQADLLKHGGWFHNECAELFIQLWRVKACIFLGK